MTELSRVSELRLLETKSWNIDLIHGIFSDDEMRRCNGYDLLRNPPPTGWVKLNVDAGFSIVRQKAVLSFIIKNEEGNILGSEFRVHHLVRTVALAEAIALLHGVQFASEMGFRYVIAESDSRVVINKINSKEDNYSETRPLTWDLKASTRNFSECRFQFVAREGNSDAHAMAEEGLRRLEDCFWVEDALVKASDLAASDRRSHRPP
ncbi:hypothetical protein PVK06_041708 [Gossypium arboreum]|uniref:RNase H type-1 domain-containing protein n=1 Tax=Gossypium arboreum TaxID=29729 RepID=A0ABR0N8Z8_GOSAR|nr:hypothetical protein PVK06_041708 [Gossypium arboreum]